MGEINILTPAAPGGFWKTFGEAVFAWSDAGK